MIAGHLREKDGHYYCVLSYTDYTGERKQIWKATGLPVKGNKKRAEEMLSHLRKTFVVPKAPADYFDFSDSMLFTDFMRAWLEVVRTTVVPTTFGGYQTTVEKKFIPYFEKKNLALANVQAKDLQTFYLHEMKTLSGTTVRHEHALLHKILKYAYRMDLIPNNPADKVDPPRAERFEGSACTEEELALLIEKSWDHKLGLLIYITALLGLHRSEVLGLRWKAIDFEENRITINHTVTEARVDGKTVIIASDRTKTKSSYRSFPMSDTVREKLLAWREVQKRNRKICGNSYNMKDIDYVFTDEMGNRFKPRYIEDAFPKILERNGLRKIRFHDLRHTCASLMHKMGLSPKEVQDYLGHSTVSVTLNIYTHLDWSSKENAAKAMENAVKLPENVQIASKWES
ncbi:MAG: tyrosine-type recombinase/integrase [Clostridia bacterium]|nr:tyrosine-type recombinase/integrase [Clostridia bacterium]